MCSRRSRFLMSLAIFAGGSITLASSSLAQSKAVAPAAGGVRDEILEMAAGKAEFVPVAEQGEEKIFQHVKGKQSKELPKELQEQERKLLEAEQELLRRSKEGDVVAKADSHRPSFVEEEDAPAAAIHGAAIVDSSPPPVVEKKKAEPKKEVAKAEAKVVEKKQAVKAEVPAAEEKKSVAPKKKEAPAEVVAKVAAPVAPTDTVTQGKLASAERRIAQLTDELKEARMKLMFAETEVERLASIIEARNLNTAQRYTGEKPRQEPAVERTNYDDPPSLVRRPAPVQVAPSVQADGEMPLATVVVDKIYLRTGPGKSNSPLMAVNKGTKLLIETRQGEWYRVITPAGARAWIASNAIAFGEQGNIPGVGMGRRPRAESSPQDDAEEKALELIKSRKQ